MRMTVGGLKGGISKSTTVWFLAAGLGRLGRTLVVDADPTSQSVYTWYCRALESGQDVPFDAVPWSGPDVGLKLRGALRQYDHAIVDTGGTGGRQLDEAMRVTRNLLIPCAPTIAEMERVPATLEWAGELEQALGEDVTGRILLVRVDGRSRDGADARASLVARGWPVMDAMVRDSVEYSRAPGIIPAGLGDYAAVLAELLATEPAGAAPAVLGGAA